MKISLVLAGVEEKRVPVVAKQVRKLWSPRTSIFLDFVYAAHIGDGSNAQHYMIAAYERALRRSEQAHLFVLVRAFRYFKKSQLSEANVTYIPNGASTAVANAVLEYLASTVYC